MPRLQPYYSTSAVHFYILLSLIFSLTHTLSISRSHTNSPEHRVQRIKQGTFHRLVVVRSYGKNLREYEKNTDILLKNSRSSIVYQWVFHILVEFFPLRAIRREISLLSIPSILSVRSCLLNTTIYSPWSHLTAHNARSARVVVNLIAPASGR